MPVTPMADAIAKQYRRFHEDYIVYVFDRKRDFDDGYSVEDMAEDTAEAMKRLGLKDACVMGCSQGGMMAQVLAAKHPELVSQLVLCSTTSSAADITENTVHEWIKIAKTGDVVALNHAFFTSIYSEAFQKKNAVALSYAEKVGNAEGLARFVKLANACLSFDARPLLDKIKCDCLVVGSSIDKVLGYEPTLELAEALRCNPIIYDQYGHVVFDEAPDLHDHILDFLEHC